MKKKIVALCLCIALAVVAIGGATLAYFTDQTDAKTNVFTVGKVDIDLTEDKCVPNSKMVPGTTIEKNPTITIQSGSEDCWVRMVVTINNASELDAIFAPSGADLTTIFTGYERSKWTLLSQSKDTEANTRTYVFGYNTILSNGEGGTKSATLFTGVAVPATVTGTQLNTLTNFTITVQGEAIQTADTFSTVSEAFAQFPTNPDVNPTTPVTGEGE